MADRLKTKEVLWDWYKSVASKVSGAPKESTFAQTGAITPQEFVEAGDLLVFKSGSWSWYVTDFITRQNFRRSWHWPISPGPYYCTLHSDFTKLSHIINIIEEHPKYCSFNKHKF